jgi:hypothetical protein
MAFFFGYYEPPLPEWRNWQTRWIQNPFLVTRVRVRVPPSALNNANTPVTWTYIRRWGFSLPPVGAKNAESSPHRTRRSATADVGGHLSKSPENKTDRLSKRKKSDGLDQLSVAIWMDAALEHGSTGSIASKLITVWAPDLFHLSRQSSPPGILRRDSIRAAASFQTRVPRLVSGKVSFHPQGMTQNRRSPSTLSEATVKFIGRSVGWDSS